MEETKTEKSCCASEIYKQYFVKMKWRIRLFAFGATCSWIKIETVAGSSHTHSQHCGVKLIRLWMAKIILNPDYEAEEGPGQRAAPHFVRCWWDSTQFVAVLYKKKYFQLQTLKDHSVDLAYE